MKFEREDVGFYEQRLIVALLLFVMAFVGWASAHDPLAAIRVALEAALPR